MRPRAGMVNVSAAPPAPAPRRALRPVGKGAGSRALRQWPEHTTRIFPAPKRPLLPRSLTVLFRRDPARDRPAGNAPREGYLILWPDGSPVAVGLDALCLHGRRLLGLGRHLSNCPERLLELVCFPLRAYEDGLTRLPGHRVRRFCLRREGARGRLHFLDGTPTDAVFDAQRDEPQVLDWLGLPALQDGDELWLDLAARAAEPVGAGRHWLAGVF